MVSFGHDGSHTGVSVYIPSRPIPLGCIVYRDMRSQTWTQEECGWNTMGQAWRTAKGGIHGGNPPPCLDAEVNIDKKMMKHPY